MFEEGDSPDIYIPPMISPIFCNDCKKEYYARWVATAEDGTVSYHCPKCRSINIHDIQKATYPELGEVE